ncbi:MAG: hypothetical protein U5L96_12185 [Owenweeksia sp.]|nr:hypothetical protein [Owenweeksia sp.]
MMVTPHNSRPTAKRDQQKDRFIGDLRNDTLLKGKTMVERYPELNDFYNRYNRYQVKASEQEDFKDFMDGLSEEERALLEKELYYYEINLKNNGGSVMPVILEFTFKDGNSTVKRMPAEIWIKSKDAFSKVFAFERGGKSRTGSLLRNSGC